MAEFLRNVVVISAVLSLLLLASGCAIDSGNEKSDSGTASSGLVLPDASSDSEQPPALPSDGGGDSSLPALPGGDGSSGGVPLFG